MEKAGKAQEEQGAGNDAPELNGNYRYEILYNFEDATKFKEWTDPGAWCITYGKQHFDSYARSLGIHYVVFMSDGYKDVRREVGEGFTKKKPHDQYGNSLICLLQSNSSPEPVYITSRWNHGSLADGTYGTEADHAYTKEEFLKVIGADESTLQAIYDTWLANKDRKTSRKQQNARKTSVIRQFKYAQMLLNNGMGMKQLLDGNVFSSVLPLAKYAHFDNEKSVGYIKKGKSNVTDNKMKWPYAVSVSNGNSAFYTIMCGKTLYPEWFLTSSEPYFVTADKFLTLENPATKSFYVFDTLHGRPLVIDGVSKFKEVSSNMVNNWGSDVNGYGFLMGSNKAHCMLNLDTMETVKAPNGNSWFESIRKIDGPKGHLPNVRWAGDGDGIYIMTYDSSAGEYCAFSTVTGRFVPLKTEGGFQIEVNGMAFSSSPSTINDEYVMMRSVSDTRVFKYVNNNDRKSLTVGEFDKFVFFKIVGHTFGIVLPYGQDKYYFYDIRLKKMVTLPDGAPFTSENYPNVAGEPDGYMLIPTVDSRNIFQAKYIVYNAKSGKVYHDNTSGYLFSLRVGPFEFNENPIVVDPNDPDREYRLPPAYDESESKRVKESRMAEFRALLERIECVGRNIF